MKGNFKRRVLEALDSSSDEAMGLERFNICKEIGRTDSETDTHGLVLTITTGRVQRFYWRERALKLPIYLRIIIFSQMNDFEDSGADARYLREYLSLKFNRV
jgi:hypothetical protein